VDHLCVMASCIQGACLYSKGSMGIPPERATVASPATGKNSPVVRKLCLASLAAWLAQCENTVTEVDMFKGLSSIGVVGAAWLLAFLFVYATARPGWAQMAARQVPQEYATVQAAIDAAQSGDVVLVAPGTYSGPVVIKGKRITLASEFHTTGDRARVNQTILDGQGGDAVVEIDESAAGTQIIGFT